MNPGDIAGNAEEEEEEVSWLACSVCQFAVSADTCDIAQYIQCIQFVTCICPNFHHTSDLTESKGI